MAFLRDNFWYKTPDCEEDANEDIYHVDMELADEKRDKFNGQREAAAGKLYQLFLKSSRVNGKKNSPDTFFVEMSDQDSDEVTRYVKSKNIKNSISWSNAYNEENIQENTVNGFQILTDGTLKKQVEGGDITIYKNIHGLGKLGVCALFLGECDLHEDNFCIVERATCFRAKKWDHGKSLSDQIFNGFKYSDIKNIFDSNHEYSNIGYNNVLFPNEILSSSFLEDEIYSAIYRIINTPFSKIESIINECISEEFEQERMRIRNALFERQQQLTHQAKEDQKYINYCKSKYTKSERSPTTILTDGEGGIVKKQRMT